MTPDEIREVFDGFIEYPEGSEKMYVTTASTLIFAQHVAKIAAEREREACARICDTTPPEPFRPSIEAAHAIRARGAK